MRFLKRRRILPRFYDANTERYRVAESHRVKRCGTCTYEVPEADIVIEDGREVCPMCMDTYTAQWLAEEQMDVARVKMDSARGLVDPPQFSIRPLVEADVAAITAITDSASNVISQSAPLVLVRTVAKTLLLKGVNFTSAMTFTYPSGITNNSAPTIAASLITLSLVAAGGMATGDYNLTVSDGLTQLGHVYVNILRVR